MNKPLWHIYSKKTRQYIASYAYKIYKHTTKIMHFSCMFCFMFTQSKSKYEKLGYINISI